MDHACPADSPQIWNNDLTISLLHSADMRPYNWSYTQFSQFNQDDSLLLASGVFLGPHNSSSGEIVVISLGESLGRPGLAPSTLPRPLPLPLSSPAHRPRPRPRPRPFPPPAQPPLPADNFALLSRVRNKPYDVFGCWLTETSLISGNLHRIGDITSCSVLWLNNAFQVRAGWFCRGDPPPRPDAHCSPPAPPPQDVESENVNVVKRLFKIQNLNASTIRTVMVADCGRFDSPDLLLDAGTPGASPSRVFDLGGEGEDEAAGPAPAPEHPKERLRRFLDGLLDARAQPQLAECALETKVAELLAQGRTKPPERSAAGAGNKLLIFTTGCLTYSPHQIGNYGQGQASGLGALGTARFVSVLGAQSWLGLRERTCHWGRAGAGSCEDALTWPPHRHQADPSAPDDHSWACVG